VGAATAPLVFVCAGAVNSTELLLRCRDQYRTLPRISDYLGRGYSGNGDFLAFAFDTDHQLEPSNGPTITTGIVYVRGQGENRIWFILEEGGFPREVGDVLQLLNPKTGWLRGLALLTRAELEHEFRSAAATRSRALSAAAQHSAVFLSMGRDKANGRIKLMPLTHHLAVEWDTRSNLSLYNSETQLCNDVAEALGGKLALNPLWERLNQPVSVHSLGGCVMADDPTRGVTDGYGQVHSYPGLYVLDGGILPAAIGVNPSHTIAAVAERNIEAVIRRTTGKGDWRAPEAMKAKPVIDPLHN
jgi:cholesterol oxidase